MSEELIYQDENIAITNKRINAFGQTYPVKQIASVGVFSTQEDPMAQTSDSSGLPGVLFFGALAGGIAGTMAESSIIGWIVFFVLVGGFILYSVNIKPVFHLRLGTSAKDIDILESKDKEYIFLIHDKINEALFDA